jgi:hypothetical protein
VATPVAGNANGDFEVLMVRCSGNLLLEVVLSQAVGFVLVHVAGVWLESP